MTLRWTEEQLANYRRFVRDINDINRLPSTAAPPFHLPNNEPGAFALGRLPTGTMNKTEAAYDAHLQNLRHAAEVLWHKFEAVKLRLADATFYTPDFAVLPASGVLEMHEVKGFMREDANVKIKVAASIYPFKFIVVRKRKQGGWDREEFS